MVNEVTAKARRSEALFRSSNAGISRRWLTNKVADLEWECAKLRVQLEDSTASNGRLEERCAKLRELTCEAHSCKTNEGCCEDCYCDEGCCPIERKMQELGIEAS